MPIKSTRQLNPQKLLQSKWTAVNPQNKEKHFIVIKLLEPELPNMPLELIELEAVHSHRSFILPWRELKKSEQWLQGWK
ncbi:TIGR02450 family Trp-rich protein [Methylomonas paludis]|uniref:TIGR02450 family Trp-rich protein n=1 Tax=Methylomonas paludis TaxID=1173101 RepID=A0A975RA57_9GAMM|nr:TIGR02450 family Trp-rich protein [Methylomonas paludis]QWF71792.1 TIGR02450 family Trp-rich protein [Methylomonas paludis]